MKRLSLFLLLLLPGICFAGETIDDQTALGTKPATADTFLIWDDNTGLTKKVAYSNLLSETGHDLVVKTADYSLQSTDLTGAFTFVNDGATGQITFTLPAGVADHKVNFYVTDAQYLKIIATNGEKIRYLSTVGAANGYIRANTVGNSISIQWTGDNWGVYEIGGTWKYDE